MRYTQRNKERKKRTKRTKRSKTQRKQRITRRRRGGNYERDVTTTQLETIPTKAYNKIVVTMPGGVMSGTTYKDHMEYEDFHGSDL